MSASQTLAAAGLLSSAGAVLVLNLVLRVINASQQTALAQVFGAGPALDAYATAASLPNLLIGLLILGPLSLSLTPMIAGATTDGERAHAWQVAGAALSVVLFVSVPLVLLGMALAPLVVKTIAPGLAAETAASAADLLRILFPAVGCAALAAVLRSMLHGLRLFAIPPTAYIVSAALLVAATVVAGPSWGIGAVAWASLTGAVIGLAGQLWILRRQGARLRVTRAVALPELRSLGGLLLTTSAAMAAMQLFGLWDRFAASYLGPGQVALLDFTLNGDKLVGGTLALSVATVLYPTLVVARREGEASLGQAAGRMLTIVGLTALPSVTALVILREPLLRLWLEHGAFQAEATQAVGDTMLAMAPAFVAWAFGTPCLMTFHAVGRMRPAAAVTALGLLGNVVATAVGATWAGLPGIGAGTSLAAVLTSAVLVGALARTIPTIPMRRVLRSLAFSGAGSFLAGTVAWITIGLTAGLTAASGTSSDLLRVSLGGASFIAMLLVTGLLLPIPELQQFRKALRLRSGR